MSSGDGPPLEVTEISEPDKIFLETVEDNGGEATTTILRAETDLTRSQIHYRIDKFGEKGLIDVDKPSKNEGNRPTKVKLSRKGRDALNSGLFEKGTQAQETVQELVRQVKTLRARLEAVEINTSTHPAHVFTESQRLAIREEASQTISIKQRTELEFFTEIFPTIAEELGYEAPSATPPGESYKSQFEYPMRDAESGEPAGPYPAQKTVVERLEEIEERVGQLEASLRAGGVLAGGDD